MSADNPSGSLLSQIRGYVDSNLQAIRSIVETNLYNALGLEPRTLQSIDRRSTPAGNGEYETGYTFNYHNPDAAVAPDTHVEVTDRGEIKRIFTQK